MIPGKKEFLGSPHRPPLGLPYDSHSEKIFLYILYTRRHNVK